MQGKVTLYHNPRCGTSRNALALIRERGIEPEIIEYLQTPPDKKTLKDLLKKLGMKPRELLRQREKEYEDLGLADPKVSDEKVLEAMLKHPILIQRPIVVMGEKALLCRPAERVLEML